MLSKQADAEVVVVSIFVRKVPGSTFLFQKLGKNHGNLVHVIQIDAQVFPHSQSKCSSLP